MGALPKKKVSPSRRDMRRSHHALTIPAVVEDKQTGEYRRPLALARPRFTT